MELHLKIIGILMIILSLVHIIFPVCFEWKKELHTISLMNRQMMYVHTFFIALTVLLMGLLCLTSAKELTETVLGKKIVAGFCLFWMIRLVIQFFGYSSKLWKGKKFETLIHVLFSLLWFYFTAVLLMIWAY